MSNNFIPRRDNSKVFQFKRDIAIVEVIRNDVLDSMQQGISYLVAKEIPRVDMEASENLDYDYIRIVKYGKEICVDMKYHSLIRVEEDGVESIYEYYLVEFVSTQKTHLRDGNYIRKDTDYEHQIISDIMKLRFTKRSLNSR